MTTEISTQNMPFFADIAELLTQARSNAYRTVNSIMVETYWKIGRRIVEEEQNGKTRAEYGDKLITLSTCEYSRNNGRMVVVAKKVAE